MEGKPLSPPRHQAVRPRPRPPDACVPNPLSSTVASIQFDRDRLPCLTPRDLASNIWSCYDLFDGGQARVYLCAWQNPPGAAQPSVIPDNRRVAIKHCLLPHGGGRFPAITTEWKFRKAGEDGEECLDRELEVLQRLHDSGCGERVVCPLAQTRWDGKWFDDPAERACRWWMPTYAYVMPAYRLGSVRSLLDDICNRRAPEAAQRHFLSMPFIAGEMATLLGELRKIHDPENGEGLMIQDLTPGNLLVDDEYVGGGGMRLLLADPGMAAKIELLKRSTDRPRRHVTGTWLWGCMAARSGSFDEGADLYSLSAVGVEMWLVAEGALATAEQTVLMLHLDQDPGMPHAVQFLRHLVLETVKTHHREGKLNPRVTRNLPVSWLGAWALLLGCRDHKTEADMASRRPHLRPSEAEMLPVYQQWARVAAAAAALPPDLTSEQAAAPGCAALVADMCGLFEQLKRLSRLEQGGELEDVPTRWLAANFMVQEHPLVAAMRAQGAASGAQPDDKGRGVRLCPLHLPTME
ncbi:putative serine threonine- kinase GCN2 isoform X1 [Chlorella sorokiniana]|uniref:Serine threonine-kinase GCN2 isoform X1 n=1 Tax=Chlorella sorokiniana TaxID=3076 RepID=A0A2P6TQZ7_CHLSO|nr:putative serine threonine- kinase GCN2 isoform X1 [Chlorella sorokiniana]|eukprot:PRW56479.1 putative serine threonine- kinase GCN2 isoform X1 [Chlorella sorokiniana]